MNVNKNRIRTKRMFWPIVANLVLYGSATETYAKLDFLYEIQGTFDACVSHNSVPASSMSHCV
jgi:hypothetical protein